MTSSELICMAERGEADGHDRAWFTTVNHDRRIYNAMIKAALAESERLKEIERNFIPTP